MPTPSAHARVAVATIWDANPGFACSLLHWCQDAADFGEILASAGVVSSASAVDLLLLLSGGSPEEQQDARRTASEDCPARMRVLLPGDELRSAVDAFVRRGGCMKTLKTLNSAGRLRINKGRYKAIKNHSQPTVSYVLPDAVQMLFKWHFFSMVEYDLVLFADLDVQLLRPEQPRHFLASRWRTGWNETVPLDGSTRFLGDRDLAGPLNAGLWTIAHPTAALYTDGLRQLREAPFNVTHGFGLLGTPAELIRNESFKWMKPLLERTRVLKSNMWGPPRIVYGDCDQGFIFWMIYVRHRLGGAKGGVPPNQLCRFHPADDAARDCPHTARHHYGPTKPWILARGASAVGKLPRISNAGRVTQYLSATRFQRLVTTSVCAARFASWLPLLPLPVPVGTHLANHGKYQRVGW